MPRVIEVTDTTVCSLDECIEGIEKSGFDPNDRQCVGEVALWLKRLANNRHFLGDMLAAELAGTRNCEERTDGYGPQAIMLSGSRNGFFLRANIWPSQAEGVLHRSGHHAFAYGLPHDHNFDFLTAGYFGPGYASDHYEYDYAAVAGFPGEAVQLRFVERSSLSPGKIMHYRAHRDVHTQIPPVSLSVSLNVMATNPAQDWYDQYEFDTAHGSVSRILTSGANETLLRIAVGLGSQSALDLARDFALSHPSDRMRLACLDAQVSVAANNVERDVIWQRAESCDSRLISTIAQRHRELLGEAKGSE